MRRLWFIGLMMFVAFSSAVATLAIVKNGISNEIRPKADSNEQIAHFQMYEPTTPTSISNTESSFLESFLEVSKKVFYKMIDLPVEKLTRLILSRVQEYFQENEPITVKVNETIDIASKDLICNIKIAEARAKNPSTFEIRDIVSDFSNKSIDFEFFYPELSLDSIRYELMGSILGHRLRASGNITANAKNVLLNGTARYELRGMKLYINYLEIHYKFKKLTATITGLEVPFVTPRQLNQIISVRMAYYLQRNEVELSKKASAKAKQYINGKIQSLGIMDILKIIWKSLTSDKRATNQQDQDFNTYSSMLDKGFQVHFQTHQT